MSETRTTLTQVEFDFLKSTIEAQSYDVIVSQLLPRIRMSEEQLQQVIDSRDYQEYLENNNA